VPFHWGRFRGLAQDLKRPPLEELLLKNVYFDSCVYHQPGIELLLKVIPTENILFGSEMVGAVRGIDPRNTEANLTAILDALQAKHIPVLLSGMYAPPNLGESYEAEFRAVFDKLGKRPGVIYDPFFLAGVAGDPALNQADHIHPNPSGVLRVVARMAPLVAKLLAEVPKP